MTTRPDVILILTDEERAAPPYENAALRTWRDENLPGRKWFLDHGVEFRRHYVASTACVPSRPSLLTGQYPGVHGVTQTNGLGKGAADSRMRWLRPDEVPTIGDWFRGAGYDTSYVGKWHVSHVDLEVDGERIATNTADGRLIPEAIDAYLSADPLDEFGFSGWIGPEPHGPDWADSGYIRDPIYADRAVAWLDDRYARRAAGDETAARPFLLVCSFVNPHDIVLWPILARTNRLAPSLAEPPPVPPSPTDDEDLSTKPALQMAYRDAYYSGYGPAAAIKRVYRSNAARYRRTYYRLHHDVDGPIDRVRAAVVHGSDEAVLVLSSDHGDMLGSHGGLHQKWYQLYDETTRVPFVVARIGAAPTTPSTVDAPTSHVDLLPTLLGVVGADEAELADELRGTHTEVHPLPGRDLSGLLDDGHGADAEPIYMITRDNMLEGDGNAAAILAARGRTEAPFPLQIRVPAHAATNVEAVVAAVDADIDGVGHDWKLVRTFDDPAGWTEPHVRQLSARGPGGPTHRNEPIPDQWELYDLTLDPVEAHNRAADPATARTRTHLETTLARLREERVPARHVPWPTATRTADRPASKSPPPPARVLRRLLQRIGMHPDDPDAVALDLRGRRALVVATNHGSLDVGKPTGVFGSELTVPYYEFLDAGMAVDIASPRGGDIPFDPQSFKPVIRSRHDDRFMVDEVCRDKVKNSLAIGDLDMADYDIVYFAGGWGAAWDLGTSEVVGEQVTVAAANGAVLGGICHGPLGLLKATTPDGEPLVKGRRITAVTDKQVDELGIGATPQHPETELRKLGAEFELAHTFRDIFANHVVVDGDLITGQNQNAGPMVAREMMQRVLAKTPERERSEV
jgi:arylsulfatase A-like enzyme/putative intracellular protease/amidase